MRNKMIKYTALLSLALLPTLLFAQGVRFESNPDWDAIVQQAKSEHKYIFVDCYATWCGPCKMMDNQVYPVAAVGGVYNREFICLRVQMDQMKNDNESIRKQYGLAQMLEQSYHVDAYPTFLFFDENGKPVHKAMGVKESKKFIRLAADAHDPNKQYYRILADFKPGKLDTADEKGLAFTFQYTDTALAGKLAADYLTRIPKQQLSRSTAVGMMIGFQNNAQVASIAVSYISNLPDSAFASKGNVQFLAALSRQSKVSSIVENYLKKLNRDELGKEANIDLMGNFKTDWLVHGIGLDYISHLSPTETGTDLNITFIGYMLADPRVQRVAKDYINRLAPDQYYTKKRLGLIAVFTKTPVDEPGFDLFYRHMKEVDAVMGDGCAESWVWSAIGRAEQDSLLALAKQTGTPPDFDAIEHRITQKYNAYYGRAVVTNGKVNWYHYLVYGKKQEAFWPQLITSRLAQLKQSGYDTLTSKGNLGSPGYFLNNICWDEIYLHGNDPAQMDTAAKWLSHVVNHDPGNFFVMDTYASLLYKAGRKDEGIAWEEKGLKIVSDQKNDDQVKLFSGKIAAMKRGEPIWDEKEYR